MQIQNEIETIETLTRLLEGVAKSSEGMPRTDISAIGHITSQMMDVADSLRKKSKPE